MTEKLKAKPHQELAMLRYDKTITTWFENRCYTTFIVVTENGHIITGLVCIAIHRP